MGELRADMGESGNSEVNVVRQAFSWQAAIGVAVMVIGTLLSVVKSGSLEGASLLLAIVFVVAAAAVACRFLFHLYAGYIRLGLGRWLLFELATACTWGALALVVVQAENPQIPRLIVCGGVIAFVFFQLATRMERARARLQRQNQVRIRRATDVFRGSWLWRDLCRGFRQIDFEVAKRVRESLSGPDRKAGFLSWAASIVLLMPAAVAALSGALAVASIVFSLPMTPPNRSDPGTGEEPTPTPGVEGKAPTRPISTGNSPAAVDDCADEYEPGSHVPEPERSSLILGWQVVPGISPGPLEALGFEIAGCPGAARPIPGSPGSWFAPGHCGEELRAIVIALRGFYHPVVMLEQAAEFALPLIRDGKFVEAVDRFAVGEGDAYVVTTSQGSYVLIRDKTTAGSVDDDLSEAIGCDGIADDDVEYPIDVSYTAVGPGMIEGWREVAAVSLDGVIPLDSVPASSDVEAFAFRSGDGIVGFGRCSTPGLSCEVKIGRGEWRPVAGGARIDQTEVRALAES